MDLEKTPMTDQPEPTQAPEEQPAAAAPAEPSRPMKFCSQCGGKIDEKAVVCPLCGCQVEQMAPVAAPSIMINNANSNVNTNTQTQTVSAAPLKKPRNKWVALLLCLFLGLFGAHKFYEGKIGLGVVYLFTGGLFFIGAVIDFVALLFKPNPYYV